MKLAIIIVASIIGVIVVAILLIALVGSFLPIKHSATRSVLLHQKVETVYAVVRDFESMPQWRTDVRNVKVTNDPNGRVRFREEGKNGFVNYELIGEVPWQSMVTRIIDTDLGYAGKWTYTFSEEGSSTRVTITENGEVSNVIFRFLSRYAFGHTATIDAYLTALGKHFGEIVQPQ